MARSFRDKLLDAQERNQSWLCVGLDPDPALMPDLPALKGPEGLTTFCQAIVEATADLVCAFKPNLAFFLAHGSAGIRALEALIAAIPRHIPVVLDAKVGDLGSTQRMYGQAAFETLGVDALTVNPYVGEDTVTPLLEMYPGRGLYVLARTSNPDAPRFQDHPGQAPYLYERVVQAAQGWAQAHPTSMVGLVVGATHPKDLEMIRRMVPDRPFLIPGVGKQGGALDAAVRFGEAASGLGPLINASRTITFASDGPAYADAARQAALQLKQSILQLRQAG